MEKIDFRSDTVSWPTENMRKAMANARIGDDVYGEDPSVIELEALAAKKVGKEAGLFVTSGTMGNLVATLAHTRRGGQAILGEDAHVNRYEAGGMAMFAGVMPKPLATDENGRMSLSAIQQAIHTDEDTHDAPTELILVENSYGTKAGYPIELDYFAQIQQIANTHQLKTHMDGARLFNAAVALGVPATEITQYVDTVTFCLSKGLCAPVGSVLCGSEDFIFRARRARKALGGGMRQAGFMAAAGIVAINEMTERLVEDHKHAYQLAAALAEMPEIKIDLDMVKTNMVFFEIVDDHPITKSDFLAGLEDENILLRTAYGSRYRAVTHYWIGEAEVEQFVTAVRQLLK